MIIAIPKNKDYMLHHVKGCAQLWEHMITHKEAIKNKYPNQYRAMINTLKFKAK